MSDEPHQLPPLVDGELELHLVDPLRSPFGTAARPGEAGTCDRTLVSPVRVPAFRFEMRVGGEKVGTATLRIAGGDYFERYAGQIGYGVEPAYRGRRYAARACRLLFALARAQGMTTLWITCNPDNVASRRTCELVGGELVDIVDVPSELDLYREGDRQKCRYRVRL